jgi:multiple sugar transport system permease protein
MASGVSTPTAPGDAAAPPRRPTGPARRRRRRVAGAVAGWGFAGPAALLVLGLSIFPATWAFLISRQRWNGIAPPVPLGWRNYERMASDPDLAAAVKHTLVFTGLFVPTSILLGMVIAVALNRRIRLVAFYRTCIFVPFVASAAATGILATFVFNPQFGAANDLLRRLGLPRQLFLEDPGQVLVVICLILLWQQVGFTVVVYLAALQDIPRDLVDAARVDGANAAQVFRHVTLPQLGPVTVFASVWQTITALQLFDLVYTTTRGGPLGASQTIVYYIWRQAFQLQRFGYGSAVAYGLFVVTMLITLGMVWYARRSRLEAF